MAIVPDMIGIVVSDMGKALAFYRMLGLDLPQGQENEPYVQTISANGYRISFNALEMVKQIDPSWQEPVGHRMELAFKCDSPAEVDAAYERLMTAGHQGHRSPWDAFWGQRYAIVVDPDGNDISLFAELKRP